MVKKNRPLQESELPLETVLNPGLIVMKDVAFKPLDFQKETTEEGDLQAPLA